LGRIDSRIKMMSLKILCLYRKRIIFQKMSEIAKNSISNIKIVEKNRTKKVEEVSSKKVDIMLSKVVTAYAREAMAAFYQ
jgi:predicted HTH domain antitoxin